MKHLVLGLVALGSAGVAQARCWEECVLYNPISGQCVRHVKVCDVENPAHAAASLTADIQTAASRLTSTWHDLWGQVPPGVRLTLGRHPLTILSLVFPETQAWALAIGAVEEYYARAQSRAHDSKTVVDGAAPDAIEWKKNIMDMGESWMLVEEGVDVATADYPHERGPGLGKYDGAWQRFVGCVAGAADAPAGGECLKKLKREVIEL